MKRRILRQRPKSTKSSKLFLKAQSIIPWSTHSSEITYKTLGRIPPFIKRTSSAFIWDEERNKYIDYTGSCGSMILGHSNPSIIKTIREVSKRGTSFGAPTSIEIKIAEFITKNIPSIEMIKMVSSNMEAIMAAIRLARIYTGKDKIIQFEVSRQWFTESSSTNILEANYNDLASVRTILEQNREQVAAIIVEPVSGNMGCIPPKNGFLQGLRGLCNEFNLLLIFNETVTGFRVALGGAQVLYDVLPDITILGSIIGAGLPIGAYGGKKEIMQTAGFESKSVSGTSSSNSIAMAAGFTLLRILHANKLIYKRLEQQSAQLEEGIRDNLNSLGLKYTFNRVGSMWTLYFTPRPVTDYESAMTSDISKFSIYLNAMLDLGIYLPQSQFATAFISTAHTERVIEKTIKANYKSLQKI